MKKSVAVVCNYKLNPDRIGSMDRFFIGFDAQAKQLGFEVDWFFSSDHTFEFYKELNVFGSKNQSVEYFFLSHLNTTEKPYNIVITHFTELCTHFYKEVKKLGRPYIIAVDHNPRPLGGFPLKKRLKNKIKGILYSKHINQFIAVSKYTKKHILIDFGSFLNSKTKVIYNGIVVNNFKKRVSDNKNKFIVASHLRESKGIHDLIHAIALLDENLKDKITVDIYGEGPYEFTLKELTKTLKLENSIAFKGSSSQLPELFCNYSYMIQPTYMECFSLSILESLTANVPVITTQVGGNLEVITHGENGFVFQAGHVNQLFNILKSILTNEIGITSKVNTKVEELFFIEKMVDEHIKCLPCI
jgi:glycosyltransferase involved in cell wall biosynthesis